MIPIVAIVGRPNVGKSTLFNRLAGRRLAIVHDEPGVTRDRHYADAHVHGRDMTIVDTGGFDPASDDPMRQGIARQVQAAIDEADVVVCVFDGSAPPTDADREAVNLLRRSDKPVVFVANKVDSPAREVESTELYELGIDHLHAISALHGRNAPDLEEAIREALPPPADEPERRAGAAVRIALVGRPNAGKSSLFNRLAGGERSLVDDRPGTTRDPIDTEFSFGGERFLIVDTAGIRRRTKVERGVEAASVIRSIRAVSRADVAVLMCDASAGVAEQDQRLLSLCAERGRAIVVALNKVDLLSRAERNEAKSRARDELRFAPWAPMLEISAKSGTGVGRLLHTIGDAAAEYHRRVTTGELNRFFEEVLERHPPPTHGGRAPRLYYITQARTAPPLFVVMTNAPDHIKASYKRFLVNRIREAFGFRSVPVRVTYRNRGRER